ncbi:type VI secretion system ATPase TssH [Gilliamella sp. Pas-s25]|uniref:type VI secretion system ATPase TssH n=1 Tax=Gilliamella sp. Pas-s25 TaxID=2687310 RepID=UPI00135E3D19|nr:type VI secretion system ATPase TssH [Gilliamella sp. Pas-s25]MWP62715.1 type VI secretion system ATPase TssH [Gilliamella sp. Pas-s25]
MIRIDLPKLVAQFHPISKQILETTATLCVSKKQPEITASHYLFQCLDTPLNDIRIILDKAKIDYQLLKQLLDESAFMHTQWDETPPFSPLLIQWFQEALLISQIELKQPQIRTGALLLALLQNPTRYVSIPLSQHLKLINQELLKDQFEQWTQGSAENISDDEKAKSSSTSFSEFTLLDRYATNVTKLARQHKLDPVLCRDEEIDLMIDILCRRRKNNPIIVGEAGVGKSALIEGLALRIINDQVPDKLKGTELMNLDLGALQAGASVKGEFEKRFKGIMSEVIESAIPIILFIDEAHTLIGAGNSAGGLDVSNLLKPALARGELKTIAATTWSEYKKYFEKDAALSRRFQLVQVNEPSADEAIVILRGLRAIYENAHGVLIDDDALQAAAILSDRYLSGRQLPDKAIDVLDTACARISINLTTPPKRVSALQNKLHQNNTEIQLLTRQQYLGLGEYNERLAELNTQNTSLADELQQLNDQWQQQRQLVDQVISLRAQLLQLEEDSLESRDDTTEVERIKLTSQLKQLSKQLDEAQTKTHLISPHVDKSQIANVIAEWTGVPLRQISQDELKIITELPAYLNQIIKGQDLAISHLHKHLLTSRADLRRPGRPLGAFLLVGPSGVGKTETVLQIANILFGGTQYLTTINMSEFQEKHTVSRLIGSPPGYIGYGEGGVLTEAIRKKPYSVVLLDEVEKAHPDVLNLFYQAFDKGEIADGEGRIIDCKNVVFFLTSNLGYQTIVQYANKPEDIIDKLYPELANFFKPALLARMEIVPYLPLSEDILKSIIVDKLTRLHNVLHTRFKADVIFDNEVAEEIINRANRSENGARMLESIIDGYLLPPVSLLLLKKVSANEKITLIHFSVNNHQFTAEIN